MGFATTAIHAGNEPDSATGAVTVPIYQTSTYAQEGLGKHKGFEYARTQNPTRLAVERNIAALEGARFGYAFASGMAAIDATLRLIKAGEHVVVSDNTYGGTFRLFSRVLSNYGIEFSFAVVDRVLVALLEESLALLPAEDSPLRARVMARLAGALQPAADPSLGADWPNFLGPNFDGSSAEKGLLREWPKEGPAVLWRTKITQGWNGHSDSVGGVVVLNDEKDAEWLQFIQNSVGSILSPFDSWLVLRGTKTLAVRMEQHDATGRKVAAFLEEHPKVKKLYYPGSLSHKQHELAKRQQRGFGGMVAFDTGSLENARTVLESVRLCTLAESLGGVETLISHPATMTHASVLPETRERLGITGGLVRISVGLEDVEDIIADLDQALEKI